MAGLPGGGRSRTRTSRISPSHPLPSAASCKLGLIFRCAWLSLALLLAADRPAVAVQFSLCGFSRSLDYLLMPGRPHSC